MCNHTETGTYYLRARYYDPRIGRFTSEDWVVNKDLSLPMTLTLADTDGNVIIDNYSPKDNQWWITGFNPEYTDMMQENLIATFTVDFSGNIDMYNAFQKMNETNPMCTFDNVNYIVTIRI